MLDDDLSVYNDITATSRGVCRSVLWAANDCEMKVSSLVLFVLLEATLFKCGLSSIGLYSL